MRDKDGDLTHARLDLRDTKPFQEICSASQPIIFMQHLQTWEGSHINRPPGRVSSLLGTKPTICFCEICIQTQCNLGTTNDQSHRQKHGGII